MNTHSGNSIKRTQERLGDCSRTHVWRMVNRGMLVAVKIGGRTLITEDSIRALLEGAAKVAA